MTFSNFKDIQELNLDLIEKEIVVTKKQLFELRLKKATRQSFKSHLFKYNKRKVAQLLTLKSQKINL